MRRWDGQVLTWVGFDLHVYWHVNKISTSQRYILNFVKPYNLKVIEEKLNICKVYYYN